MTRGKRAPAGSIFQALRSSHRNEKRNASPSLFGDLFAFGREELEHSMRTEIASGDSGSVPVTELGDEVVEEMAFCRSEPEGILSSGMDSSSEVITDVCGELPPRSQEAQSMATESWDTEWTDEKHSSYLNSMEASFVRQLQNQEFFSGHLVNWTCKKRKVLIQRNAQPSIGCVPVTGQFTILQEGCWQKLNFDCADNDIQKDAVKETQGLLANPWIRYFSTASSSKAQKSMPFGASEKSSSQTGKGPLCEWNEGVPRTSETHLEQIPGHRSHCHLQMVPGNNKEMSDQNFSDEENKDESVVKRTQMKRPRKMQNVATGVDQVVPLHQVENSGGSTMRSDQEEKTNIGQESGD